MHSLDIPQLYMSIWHIFSSMVVCLNSKYTFQFFQLILGSFSQYHSSLYVAFHKQAHLPTVMPLEDDFVGE